MIEVGGFYYLWFLEELNWKVDFSLRVSEHKKFARNSMAPALSVLRH
jgi:hypothetical protein